MKHLPTLIFLLVCAPALAQNDTTLRASRYFDGLYLGANVGSQNLFGGSFVDGVDVLAQESRFVAELLAGYRKQIFKGRIMLGAEVRFGFTDGDLKHEDPSKSLTIHYKNDTQSSLGMTLGATLGKRKNWLAFAYCNETTRRFEVSVSSRGESFRQKDEQGMLKYGAGIEIQIWQGLNACATAGRLRVDFGDRVTNIDVEDMWDFTIGITYQF